MEIDSTYSFFGKDNKMIFREFNQNFSNEELPIKILEQRIGYRSIDRKKLQVKEITIENLKYIRDDIYGRYIVTGVGDKYPLHIFFNPYRTTNGERKLYICFFAAREVKNENGHEKFRDVPFYPRWSYSNFLDGDVLCIEDPMYYRYGNLHIGWMFGSLEFNLLDDVSLKLDEFIKSRYNKKNVYLIGSSCGGYAALQIGARLNGVSVITINPQIFINNYKYYFTKFLKITGIDKLNNNDDRLNTDKLMANSDSTFVIACNMLSDEDYYDQFLKLATNIDIKINYGVTKKNNILLWAYQAQWNNPHSTMEDHNLIYALINLVQCPVVDKNLYLLFSEIWSNNFTLRSDTNKLQLPPPRYSRREGGVSS